MRKVLIGLAASAAGYQAYGVYGIYHPGSNFRGGWERLKLEASKNDKELKEKKIFPQLPADPNLPPYPVPSGLFNIRVNFPAAELETYLQATKSDLFYLDFRGLDFEPGSLYNAIKSQIAAPLDVADITDADGHENILTLLRDVSFRMIEMTTRHQFNQMKSRWSPQSWNDFFYRRFLSQARFDVFSFPRYPVVLVEGCEKWQQLFDEDTGDDKAKQEKKEEKLLQLFNFLKWLYVIRLNTHIILLTKSPLDPVLDSFFSWFQENFKDTQEQRLARSQLEKEINS